MWTLFKRGDIWWGTKTEGDVRERSSTRCRDKRAAELVLKQWERADADPRHHAAYTTTLDAALVAMIAERRARGKAAGTLSMYEQKSAHLVRLLGRERVLADIGAAEVDFFWTTRIEEGAKRSTVGKELTTLRSALRLARRRGQFDKDVAEVMPVGWTNDYTPRKTFLTPDQLAKLLAELEPRRARHVAFIVATGVRWSESLRAERADVDLETWEVRVRGTKTELSDATISTSPLGRALLRMSVERAQKSGSMFEKWDSVRRDLAAACRRASVAAAIAAGVVPEHIRGNGSRVWDAAKLEPHRVPRVTANDLRRTCASWMMQGGASLFAASRVLRHKDTRMLSMVYGQVPPRELRRLLEREITVTETCQTDEDSGDSRDSGDDAVTTNPPENQCPGAESNRRHADFQSATPDSASTEDTSSNTESPSVIVTGTCPDSAAFRERSHAWFTRDRSAA